MRNLGIAVFALLVCFLGVTLAQDDIKTPHQWLFDAPMCEGVPTTTRREQDVVPNQLMNRCVPGPGSTSLDYSCMPTGGTSYLWLSEMCQGPKITRTWRVGFCANFTNPFSKTKSMAHQCSNHPNQRIYNFPTNRTLDTTHPIGPSEPCPPSGCESYIPTTGDCQPNTPRFTLGRGVRLNTCLYDRQLVHNMRVTCEKKGYIKLSYWHGGGCQGQPFDSVEYPTDICIPSFFERRTFMMHCP